MVRGVAVVALLAWVGIAHADPRSATYMREVHDAIKDQWVNYAELERAAAATGSLGPWQCTVRVTLDLDGRLLQVQMTSPSGLQALDDEALRVVRAAAFPSGHTLTTDPSISFPLYFGIPGWPPPTYQGDARARTPLASDWEVGTDVDVERHARALTGSTAIVSSATYERDTLAVVASKPFPRIGTIELVIPYEAIRYRADDGTGSVSGFGDALVHVHARYISRHVWFDSFLGFTVPTGATTTTAIVGTTVPAVVQLGSGTFEPDIGLCLDIPIVESTVIGACAHDRISLYNNSHGYREPSVDDYRLFATTAPFGRRVSGLAGILFESQDTELVGALNTPYAGHDELFAEASIWVLIYRGLAARATVELPLYETVDGTQLGDSFRAMVALAYDFSR